MPVELYSKFIEFCKSVNKCRLKFHMTQEAISSFHEAYTNIFELDSLNQKLQNFMTKFANSKYLQKKILSPWSVCLHDRDLHNTIFDLYLYGGGGGSWF